MRARVSPVRARVSARTGDLALCDVAVPVRARVLSVHARVVPVRARLNPKYPCANSTKSKNPVCARVKKIMRTPTNRFCAQSKVQLGDTRARTGSTRARTGSTRARTGISVRERIKGSGSVRERMHCVRSSVRERIAFLNISCGCVPVRARMLPVRARMACILPVRARMLSVRARISQK